MKFKLLFAKLLACFSLIKFLSEVIVCSAEFRPFMFLLFLPKDFKVASELLCFIDLFCNLFFELGVVFVFSGNIAWSFRGIKVSLYAEPSYELEAAAAAF